MNIASLLVGEGLGSVGMQAASQLLEGVFQGNSKFSNLLDGLNGSNSISIDEMNLSAEELSELNQVREFAMNRGLTDIEVMIDGSKFNLNVRDNTLTAKVS